MASAFQANGCGFRQCLSANRSESRHTVEQRRKTHVFSGFGGHLGFWLIGHVLSLEIVLTLTP